MYVMIVAQIKGTRKIFFFLYSMDIVMPMNIINSSYNE